MELKNKVVAIIGLGERTGVETVAFLAKQGAEIIVSDSKTERELKTELAKIADYKVELDLGGHTTELILKADLIIVSPGVPPKISILKKAFAAGIEIISEIELAYRFNQAQLVAITGTNGKTTTTTLLGEICQQSYSNQVVVGGNIGRPLIKDLPYLSKIDLALAEISSFQLELIDQFQPDIALFLNITPDHLNRHGDFESYLAAKKELFKNQTATDYLILNYDDQIIRELAREAKAEVIYFSRKQRLDEGVFVKDGLIISNIKGESKQLLKVEELAIKGPHNLENALAAIAVAEILDLNRKQVVSVLKSFSGVEHRIERLDSLTGAQFINDSKATNPAASIKAVETFNQPIILIAGGKDKEADFTELLTTGKDKIKALILLGQTSKQLNQAAKDMGYKKRYQVDNMEQAVDLAYELAETDDVVLLSPACSSLDMYSNYEERGRSFKMAVDKLRRK